ncbi:MAG: ABC transporter permease [Acidobacteria bacterium]|nr:ABC transporter permease [Acidobacteriota bacterium]MCW5970006.1 ABC transporter permease [Blastocatellales bacterium]
MNSLIASNLGHHPGRTAASVIGVAVGVVLVVMTVGLVRGALRDRGQRDANIGVEIMVTGQGQGISIASSDLTLPVELAGKIAAIPGVAAATPVGQNLELKGDNGIGIRQIDGIDYASFTAAGKLRVEQGEPLPEKGDVAIIDFKYAADKKLKIGDRIEGFDREFTIIGIYAPEAGPRIKVPLKTMQEALGVDGKCSMIYVKCVDAAEQEAIAQRIIADYPDLRIIFTRDLPELYATGYAGFNVFLNIIAGLATVISLLVILLTMYTTVTERTRQIGIMKSLGASRSFIAGVFVREALTISIIGVGAGLVVSLAARAILVGALDWRVQIEPGYVAYAALAGIASGIIGALYPALRAASQDPIDALSYE